MLFTGKGDNGTTTTFGCNQRLSKSSVIAEALGALDEANSLMGVCKALLAKNSDTYRLDDAPLAGLVHDAQETLFIIQAAVAGAPQTVAEEKVTKLGELIGSMEDAMPPIKVFSIPGATELSAQLDTARTVARRTERRVVAVSEEGTVAVAPEVLAYLNRLSSLLFAMARYVNHVQGVDETAPSYK